MNASNNKIIRDPHFFRQPALSLAPQLLGKNLVRVIQGQKLICKIVEVEAYVGPEDKGAHTFNNKRTPRTETMFWSGGHIYVYLIYGMYYCMNIVAANENQPQAVLIRAVQPLEGIEMMQQLRPLKHPQLKQLTNGPGKLTKALAIDKTCNGLDLLTSNTFYLENGDVPEKIVTTSRINIDYAEEFIDVPWRFYIADNPFVSKK